MAYEEALVAISRPAGEDLSDWAGLRFTAVKLNSNGAVVKTAAITDTPVGILLNDPKTGEPARLAVDGVSKVRLAGTVAAGDQLGINAAGRLVAAVATNRVIGHALTSGVTGDIIPAAISLAGAPIKA